MSIFWKNYLPLLLWLLVIFFFSSIPGGVKSSEPDFWFYAQRKGAHIFEYFILFLLFWNALRAKMNKRHVLWIGAVLSLVYAFSDEFHQAFVFGREGKISDVGIDLIGIFFGVAIILIFLRKKECLE